LPFPISLDDPPCDQGITAGILDIDTALLDPGTDWIKKNGGDWQKAPIRRWNGAFEMRPFKGSYLRMNDIYRLAKMSDNKWVAYANYPNDAASSLHRGEVVRFGPGMLERPEQPQSTVKDPKVVLELCDGTLVGFAELDDVLLSTPLGIRIKQCQ
jgi:hypothetical protein